MEDSPLPIPIFLLPTRQLIPARSCTAQHRIGMTNGTGTPHSSLARNEPMGSPWRTNRFFQTIGIHRFGHADDAIAGLNNCQTVWPAKTEGFALAVQQIFPQRLGFHRLGHADDAIARLTKGPGQTARPESQPQRQKKEELSKRARGREFTRPKKSSQTGIYFIDP